MIEQGSIAPNDAVVVPILDTVVVSITDTLFIPHETGVVNFILIRHAEKSSDCSDPVLTEEGKARAEKLAIMFSKIELDRVYSTNYNRTRQTVQPTADSHELPITSYGGYDQSEVIEDVLENLNEGTLLIVGHSNSTPGFLNILTGSTDYPAIQEEEFDNLFLVSSRSIGDSDVVHLKY